MPAAPDSAARSPTHQIVKLGVRGFVFDDFMLSYERQLAERWSVSGGLGYNGHSVHFIRAVYDADYTLPPIIEKVVRRNRYYTAEAQLRYYFPRRKPRPVSGWFAMASLHGHLYQYRRQHSHFPEQNDKYHGTAVQLRLALGRQWNLGRRIVLDTYLGNDVTGLYTGFGQGPRLRRVRSYFEPGVGLQLGYRFRHLPPR